MLTLISTTCKLEVTISAASSNGDFSDLEEHDIAPGLPAATGKNPAIRTRRTGKHDNVKTSDSPRHVSGPAVHPDTKNREGALSSTFWYLHDFRRVCTDLQHQEDSFQTKFSAGGLSAPQPRRKNPQAPQKRKLKHKPHLRSLKERFGLSNSSKSPSNSPERPSDSSEPFNKHPALQTASQSKRSPVSVDEYRLWLGFGKQSREHVISEVFSAVLPGSFISSGNELGWFKSELGTRGNRCPRKPKSYDGSEAASDGDYTSDSIQISDD